MPHIGGWDLERSLRAVAKGVAAKEGQRRTEKRVGEPVLAHEVRSAGATVRRGLNMGSSPWLTTSSGTTAGEWRWGGRRGARQWGG